MSETDKDTPPDGADNSGSKTEQVSEDTVAPVRPKKNPMAGNRSMMLVVVLAIIAFLAGVAIFPLFQNGSPNRQPAIAAAAQAKLKSLERAMTGAAADLEALRQQVDDLQSRLRTELKQEQQSATKNALGLSARIDELQEQARGLSQKLSDLPKQAADAVGIDPAVLDRIAQLEVQLKQTAGQLAEKLAASDGGGGLKQLSGSIAALKEQLRGQIQAAAGLAAAQKQKIEKYLQQNQGLVKKIARLEAALGAQSTAQRQDAMGLALADLSRALAVGSKTDGALAAMQLAAKSNTELQAQVSALKGLLTTQIASIGKLQRQFPDLARRALAAERASGDSIWSSTLKRLGGLISLRRTGEVPGDSVEAVLARAEKRLNDNDLSGAVKQLTGLQGPALAALKDWLALAKRRLAAEAAVAQLRLKIIADMAAAK